MEPGQIFLNGIFDFPNQYSLNISCDKNVIQNPDTNKILRGDKFSLSSESNTSIQSGRIKNKCNEFLITNSEIHVKILKNLKSAFQTMEDEKTNSNLNCQSILDKLKPVGRKEVETIESKTDTEFKQSKRK